MSVEVLSGPDSGETINVRASALWTPDQIDFAKDRRTRDLRIDELDRENPADPISELAIEILCSLVTGDTDFASKATVEVVLSQLGRPTDLTQLHELAYAIDEPYDSIVAPAEAWRILFEELARSVPELIEEQASSAAAGYSWIGEAERAAAIARLRLWAGLPPIAPALKLPSTPPEAKRGKQKQGVENAAAELLESDDQPLPPADSLEQAFHAYQRAQEEIAQQDLSAAREFKVDQKIWNFAEELCDFSEGVARPLMSWLLEAIGVRGISCDHIVWSSYSSQHPRTLHLFPDGHLFPEEDGVSRNHPGTLTACGQQILLRWTASRSWHRAGRGEWLEHYEALGEYREKVVRYEAAEEPLPYRYFDPDYDLARRICEKCAAFHGLSPECLESRDANHRWPPWRIAEIKRQAYYELLDRLRTGRPIASLERAQRVGLEVWLQSEVALTARELKTRGPGPLRRLFDERDARAPSRYERWSAVCEPMGLEPHELLSHSLWERVLIKSIELFDGSYSPRPDRRRPRDEIQDVVEARMAAL